MAYNANEDYYTMADDRGRRSNRDYYAGNQLYDNAGLRGYKTSYAGGSYKLKQSSAMSDGFSEHPDNLHRRDSRRCCVVLSIAGLFFLIAAGIAIAVFFGAVDKPETIPPEATTQAPTPVLSIDLTLTMDQTYDTDLDNTSSQLYQTLTTEVEGEIDANIRSGSQGSSYIGSRVTGLSSGSILVATRVDFMSTTYLDGTTEKTITPSSVQLSLKEELTKSSSQKFLIAAIEAHPVTGSGKTDLGGGCSAVVDCEDRNTICTGSVKTCACEPTHFESNGGMPGGVCSPKLSLGLSCPNPTSALPDTATCSDSIARCEGDATSGYKCQCPNTHYDDDGLDVIGGNCVLKANYNTTCNFTRECITVDSECNNNTKLCQCSGDMYLDDVKCFPKLSLDLSCPNPTSALPDTATCSDSIARCEGDATSGYKCQCPNTHYDDDGLDVIGGKCLLKLSLDLSCPNPTSALPDTATCSDSIARCEGDATSGYKCQCPNTHYDDNGLDVIGGNCVLKANYNTTCNFTRECITVDSECNSNTKLCQCSTDMYLDDVKCFPKFALDLSCPNPTSALPDTATCSDSIARCEGDATSGYKCQCPNTHYDDDGLDVIGGMCVLKFALDLSCPNPTSALPDTATCSDSIARCEGDATSGYKCQCPNTHYDDDGLDVIGGKCVLKANYNTTCNFTRECITVDSECNNNTKLCQCSGDMYLDDVKCFPKFALDLSCPNPTSALPDTATCSDSIARCEGDATSGYKCQCPNTHYDDNGLDVIGGKCVLKLSLDLSCPNPTSALPDTATCSDSIARCEGDATSGYKCQCPNTHYDDDGLDVIGGKCVLKANYNTTCNFTRECITVDSECNNNTKLCQCSGDMYLDDVKCFPKFALDLSCPNPTSALPDTATCSDSIARCEGDATSGYKCQCPNTYYDDNGLDVIGGKCVLKLSLDLSCPNPTSALPDTATCSDSIARCEGDATSGYKCQCPNTHYDDDGLDVIGGKCVLKAEYGGSCMQNQMCKTGNGKCLIGTCGCSENYIHESANDTCIIKTKYNTTCTFTGECITVDSECNNYTKLCQCSTDMYLDEVKCFPKKPIAALCFLSKECSTSGAVCDNECKCPTDTYYDIICIPKVVLGGTCDNADQCLHDGAECNGTNQCSCPSMTYESETSCLTKHPYGNICTGNKECKTGICEKQQCDCLAIQYYDDASETCFAMVGYGGSCTAFEQCDTDNVGCTSGMCLCPSNRFLDDKNSCLEKLGDGQNCSTNVECSYLNSTCTSGSCTCPYGTFVNNAGQSCDPKKANGEECNGINECAADESECVITCRCPTDTYLNGSVCTPMRLNGFQCQDDRGCAVGGARCLNNICQCMASDYLNSTQCIERLDFDGVCTAVEDCKDIFTCLNSMCSCQTGTTYDPENSVCNTDIVMTTTLAPDEVVILTMEDTLIANTTYDPDLGNTTSPTYIQKAADIKAIIDDLYQNVTGFVGSGNVTFEPGSTFITYTIIVNKKTIYAEVQITADTVDELIEATSIVQSFVATIVRDVASTVAGNIKSKAIFTGEIIIPNDPPAIVIDACADELLYMEYAEGGICSSVLSSTQSATSRGKKCSGYNHLLDCLALYYTFSDTVCSWNQLRSNFELLVAGILDLEEISSCVKGNNFNFRPIGDVVTSNPCMDTTTMMLIVQYQCVDEVAYIEIGRDKCSKVIELQVCVRTIMIAVFGDSYIDCHEVPLEFDLSMIIDYQTSIFIAQNTDLDSCEFCLAPNIFSVWKNRCGLTMELMSYAEPEYACRYLHLELQCIAAFTTLWTDKCSMDSLKKKFRDDEKKRFLKYGKEYLTWLNQELFEQCLASDMLRLGPAEPASLCDNQEYVNYQLQFSGCLPDKSENDCSAMFQAAECINRLPELRHCEYAQIVKGVLHKSAEYLTISGMMRPDGEWERCWNKFVENELNPCWINYQKYRNKIVNVCLPHQKSAIQIFGNIISEEESMACSFLHIVTQCYMDIDILEESCYEQDIQELAKVDVNDWMDLDIDFSHCKVADVMDTCSKDAFMMLVLECTPYLYDTDDGGYFNAMESKDVCGAYSQFRRCVVYDNEDCVTLALDRLRTFTGSLIKHFNVAPSCIDVYDDPNVCPDVQGDQNCKSTYPYCTSHHACSEDEYCCNTGCRYECLDTRENDGICPAQAIQFKTCDGVVNCDVDKDCMATEKCCDSNCQNACVDAVEEVYCWNVTVDMIKGCAHEVVETNSYYNAPWKICESTAKLMRCLSDRLNFTCDELNVYRAIEHFQPEIEHMLRNETLKYLHETLKRLITFKYDTCQSVDFMDSDPCYDSKLIDEVFNELLEEEHFEFPDSMLDEVNPELPNYGVSAAMCRLYFDATSYIALKLRANGGNCSPNNNMIEDTVYKYTREKQTRLPENRYEIKCEAQVCSYAFYFNSAYTCNVEWMQMRFSQMYSYNFPNDTCQSEELQHGFQQYMLCIRLFQIIENKNCTVDKYLDIIISDPMPIYFTKETNYYTCLGDSFRHMLNELTTNESVCTSASVVQMYASKFCHLDWDNATCATDLNSLPDPYKCMPVYGVSGCVQNITGDWFGCNRNQIYGALAGYTEYNMNTVHDGCQDMYDPCVHPLYTHPKYYTAVRMCYDFFHNITKVRSPTDEAFCSVAVEAAECLKSYLDTLEESESCSDWNGVETVASFLSTELALYIQMHDDEDDDDCDISTLEMQMTVDYLFKNITKCQAGPASSNLCEHVEALTYLTILQCASKNVTYRSNDAEMCMSYYELVMCGRNATIRIGNECSAEIVTSAFISSGVLFTKAYPSMNSSVCAQGSCYSPAALNAANECMPDDLLYYFLYDDMDIDMCRLYSYTWSCVKNKLDGLCQLSGQVITDIVHSKVSRLAEEYRTTPSHTFYICTVEAVDICKPDDLGLYARLFCSHWLYDLNYDYQKCTNKTKAQECVQGIVDWLQHPSAVCEEGTKHLDKAIMITAFALGQYNVGTCFSTRDGYCPVQEAYAMSCLDFMSRCALDNDCVNSSDRCCHDGGAAFCVTPTTHAAVYNVLLRLHTVSWNDEFYNPMSEASQELIDSYRSTIAELFQGYDYDLYKISDQSKEYSNDPTLAYNLSTFYNPRNSLYQRLGKHYDKLYIDSIFFVSQQIEETERCPAEELIINHMLTCIAEQFTDRWFSHEDYETCRIISSLASCMTSKCDMLGPWEGCDNNTVQTLIDKDRTKIMKRIEAHSFGGARVVRILSAVNAFNMEHCKANYDIDPCYDKKAIGVAVENCSYHLPQDLTDGTICKKFYYFSSCMTILLRGMGTRWCDSHQIRSSVFELLKNMSYPLSEADFQIECAGVQPPMCTFSGLRELSWWICEPKSYVFYYDDIFCTNETLQEAVVDYVVCARIEALSRGENCSVQDIIDIIISDRYNLGFIPQSENLENCITGDTVSTIAEELTDRQDVCTSAIALPYFDDDCSSKCPINFNEIVADEARCTLLYQRVSCVREEMKNKSFECEIFNLLSEFRHEDSPWYMEEDLYNACIDFLYDEFQMECRLPLLSRLNGSIECVDHLIPEVDDAYACSMFSVGASCLNAAAIEVNATCDSDMLPTITKTILSATVASLQQCDPTFQFVDAYSECEGLPIEDLCLDENALFGLVDHECRWIYDYVMSNWTTIDDNYDVDATTFACRVLQIYGDCGVNVTRGVHNECDLLTVTQTVIDNSELKPVIADYNVCISDPCQAALPSRVEECMSYGIQNRLYGTWTCTGYNLLWYCIATPSPNVTCDNHVASSRLFLELSSPYYGYDSWRQCEVSPDPPAICHDVESLKKTASATCNMKFYDFQYSNCNESAKVNAVLCVEKIMRLFGKCDDEAISIFAPIVVISTIKDWGTDITMCFDDLTRDGYCPLQQVYASCRACEYYSQEQYQCVVDAECTTGSKCCYDGCEMTCQVNAIDPITVETTIALLGVTWNSNYYQMTHDDTVALVNEYQPIFDELLAHLNMAAAGIDVTYIGMYADEETTGTVELHFKFKTFIDYSKNDEIKNFFQATPDRQIKYMDSYVTIGDVPDKIGTCPRYSLEESFLYKASCCSDNDCSDEQKCCSINHQNVCLQPIKDLVECDDTSVLLAAATSCGFSLTSMLEDLMAISSCGEMWQGMNCITLFLNKDRPPFTECTNGNVTDALSDLAASVLNTNIDEINPLFSTCNQYLLTVTIYNSLCSMNISHERLTLNQVLQEQFPDTEDYHFVKEFCRYHTTKLFYYIYSKLGTYQLYESLTGIHSARKKRQAQNNTISYEIHEVSSSGFDYCNDEKTLEGFGIACVTNNMHYQDPDDWQMCRPMLSFVKCLSYKVGDVPGRSVDAMCEVSDNQVTEQIVPALLDVSTDQIFLDFLDNLYMYDATLCDQPTGDCTDILAVYNRVNSYCSDDFSKILKAEAYSFEQCSAYKVFKTCAERIMSECPERAMANVIENGLWSYFDQFKKDGWTQMNYLSIDTHKCENNLCWSKETLMSVILHNCSADAYNIFADGKMSKDTCMNVLQLVNCVTNIVGMMSNITNSSDMTANVYACDQNVTQEIIYSLLLTNNFTNVMNLTWLDPQFCRNLICIPTRLPSLAQESDAWKAYQNSSDCSHLEMFMGSVKFAAFVNGEGCHFSDLYEWIRDWDTSKIWEHDTYGYRNFSLCPAHSCSDYWDVGSSGIKVEWTINYQNVTFTIAIPASDEIGWANSRWIGLGITATAQMSNTDIRTIQRYSNGLYVMKNRYATGHSMPLEDNTASDSNDSLEHWSDPDDQTDFVRFTLPRNSSNLPNDAAIYGELYLLLATGNLAENEEDIMQHDSTLRWIMPEKKNFSCQGDRLEQLEMEFPTKLDHSVCSYYGVNNFMHRYVCSADIPNIQSLDRTDQCIMELYSAGCVAEQLAGFNCTVDDARNALRDTRVRAGVFGQYINCDETLNSLDSCEQHLLFSGKSVSDKCLRTTASLLLFPMYGLRSLDNLYVPPGTNSSTGTEVLLKCRVFEEAIGCFETINPYDGTGQCNTTSYKNMMRTFLRLYQHVANLTAVPVGFMDCNIDAEFSIDYNTCPAPDVIVGEVAARCAPIVHITMNYIGGQSPCLLESVLTECYKDPENMRLNSCKHDIIDESLKAYDTYVTNVTGGYSPLTCGGQTGCVSNKLPAASNICAAKYTRLIELSLMMNMTRTEMCTLAPMYEAQTVACFQRSVPECSGQINNYMQILKMGFMMLNVSSNCTGIDIDACRSSEVLGIVECSPLMEDFNWETTPCLLQECFDKLDIPSSCNQNRREIQSAALDRINYPSLTCETRMKEYKVELVFLEAFLENYYDMNDDKTVAYIESKNNLLLALFREMVYEVISLEQAGQGTTRAKRQTTNVQMNVKVTSSVNPWSKIYAGYDNFTEEEKNGFYVQNVTEITETKKCATNADCFSYKECIEGICQCADTVCTDEFDPVCGTNGNESRTFSNKCQLDSDYCTSMDNGYEPYEFLYDGFCTTEPKVCSANYFDIASTTVCKPQWELFKLYENCQDFEAFLTCYRFLAYEVAENCSVWDLFEAINDTVLYNAVVPRMCSMSEYWYLYDGSAKVGFLVKNDMLIMNVSTTMNMDINSIMIGIAATHNDNNTDVMVFSKDPVAKRATTNFFRFTIGYLEGVNLILSPDYVSIEGFTEDGVTYLSGYRSLQADEMYQFVNIVGKNYVTAYAIEKSSSNITQTDRTELFFDSFSRIESYFDAVCSSWNINRNILEYYCYDENYPNMTEAPDMCLTEFSMRLCVNEKLSSVWCSTQETSNVFQDPRFRQGLLDTTDGSICDVEFPCALSLMMNNGSDIMKSCLYTASNVLFMHNLQGLNGYPDTPEPSFQCNVYGQAYQCVTWRGNVNATWNGSYCGFEFIHPVLIQLIHLKAASMMEYGLIPNGAESYDRCTENFVPPNPEPICPESEGKYLITTVTASCGPHVQQLLTYGGTLNDVCKTLGECAMGLASWYIENGLCGDEINDRLFDMKANEEYRKYFLNATGFDWSTCKDGTTDLCDPACKGYEVCDVDGSCVCSDMCITQYKPVCGFNEASYETFSNECELQKALCNHRQSGDDGGFVQVYEGKCDTMACGANVETYNCVVAPCDVTKCPNRLEATCMDNYCEGCHAQFSVNGKDVTSMCNDEDSSTRCVQKSDSGNCDAEQPSWYFDEDTLTCEKFIYSGCGGNTNRFNTYEQCRGQCVCDPTCQWYELCSVNGSCVCPDVCIELFEPVCGFNDASYETFSNECELQKALCNHRQSGDDGGFVQVYEGKCDTRPCEYHGAIYNDSESFHDDCNTCTCTYGSVSCTEMACAAVACGANVGTYNCEVAPCDVTKCPNQPEATCMDNYCEGCHAQFSVNRKDVTSMCNDEDSSTRCVQKSDSGNCDAEQPSWYFDADTLTCEKFNYSGCGGNTNRFNTYEQCRGHCVCNSTCQWYESCDVDGSCVCPDMCITQHEPVCGFNDSSYETFSNECELQKALCNHRQSGDDGGFVQVYKGECDTRPCKYHGAIYNDSESFHDDCNTCTCTYGSVSCTEMACADCDAVLALNLTDVTGINVTQPQDEQCMILMRATFYVLNARPFDRLEDVQKCLLNNLSVTFPTVAASLAMCARNFYWHIEMTIYPAGELELWKEPYRNFSSPDFTSISSALVSEVEEAMTDIVGSEKLFARVRRAMPSENNATITEVDMEMYLLLSKTANVSLDDLEGLLEEQSLIASADLENSEQDSPPT